MISKQYNIVMKLPIRSFRILVGSVGLLALNTVATAESLQAMETAPTPPPKYEQVQNRKPTPKFIAFCCLTRKERCVRYCP